jgi:hypothetical protein
MEATTETPLIGIEKPLSVAKRTLDMCNARQHYETFTARLALSGLMVPLIHERDAWNSPFFGRMGKEIMPAID